jgi:hypothetical protein
MAIMVEVARSNDLVYLSWMQAMLAAEGIPAVLLDNHTSAIEGSIGAIPRRLVVEEDDLDRAKETLAAAEAAELE